MDNGLPAAEHGAFRLAAALLQMNPQAAEFQWSQPPTFSETGVAGLAENNSV